MDFLGACLAKLGLQVNPDSTMVPSLSRIHISAMDSQGAAGLVSSLNEIVTVDDGEEYIKDDNDTFRLEKPSSLRMNQVAEALSDSLDQKTDTGVAHDHRIIDYDAIVKEMVVHEDLPESNETPHFDHRLFYSNLREYRSQSRENVHEFGSYIMYGEVVTSTNTLLEK
jgi:biotin--protein ligase